MERVSVVIPTNKWHAYLPLAIDSIINQTYPAEEIIIVNDGGGDTLSNQLRISFPNIVVIDLLHNRGVSAARNIGAATATSQLIAFLDSDDIAEPARLEKQQQALQANPDWHAVHCGSQTFDQNGAQALHNNKPAILKPCDILLNTHVIPSCLMIKRDSFIRCNGYDENMHVAEDADLTIRMVKNGYLIGFLDENLVKFRRMNHGNASTQWKHLIHGKTQLLFKHWSFYVEHGGILQPLKFSAFWLIRAGWKCGGITGAVLRATGYILSKLSGMKTTQQ